MIVYVGYNTKMHQAFASKNMQQYIPLNPKQTLCAIPNVKRKDLLVNT